MQEAVHLTLPSVAIVEDADPGNNALQEENGKGPDKGQRDGFQVGPKELLGLLSAAVHKTWSSLLLWTKGCQWMVQD